MTLFQQITFLTLFDYHFHLLLLRISPEFKFSKTGSIIFKIYAKSNEKINLEHNKTSKNIFYFND